VLMGSVITRDEALHLKIKLSHMRLGLGIGANDAEAVLRGLPSIALRYDAHDRAARVLAAWMGQRPEVAALLHPAFAGSPGHDHWRAVCGDGGKAAGLFSVVLDPKFSQTQVDKFCDGLRLFKLGYSWGGPISLVVPYDMPSMRHNWPHKGVLVRFSVGLEDVADLQADLAQALAGMQAWRHAERDQRHDFINLKIWKTILATPNYGYEKRQKELAKKRKKEDKLRAKADRKSDVGDDSGDGQDSAPDNAENASVGTAPPAGS
jgi:hypothetical protein